LAAARSGDANAFKTAFNALAQTCKSCHDSYRNR
jgi:cytochrome c556